MALALKVFDLKVKKVVGKIFVPSPNTKQATKGK